MFIGGCRFIFFLDGILFSFLVDDLVKSKVDGVRRYLNIVFRCSKNCFF